MMAARKARMDGIREEARKKRLSGGAVLEMYGFVELPAEEASSKGDAPPSKNTSRAAAPKKSAPAAPQRRSLLMRAVADKAGRSGAPRTDKKEAPKRKVPELVTVAERPPFRVVEEAGLEEEGLVRSKKAKAAAPIPDAIPIADKEEAKVVEPTLDDAPIAPDSTPPVAEVQGESSVRETERVGDTLENLRQIIVSPARIPPPTGDASAPTSESVADTEVAMRLGRQAFLPRDERDLVGRPMDQLQRLFTGSVFRVRMTP
jgi:hypothetical protein